MLPYGKVSRGKFRLLNVAAVGFLVVSLGAIAYSTNSQAQIFVSQAKKGLTNAQQKIKDRAQNYQNFADSRIRKAERETEGGCSGAGCVTTSNTRPCIGTGGCDPSTTKIIDTSLPKNSGLLGSQYTNGDIAGFYKIGTKYYPIAESAGGPSTGALNDLITKNTGVVVTEPAAESTTPQQGQPQSSLVTGGVTSTLDQNALTQPNRTLSGPGVAPGTIIVQLNPDGTIPTNIGPVDEHGTITLNTGGTTKLGTAQTGDKFARVQERTNTIQAVGSAGTGTTAFIPNIINIITNPSKNIFQKSVSIVQSVGVIPLFVTTNSSQPGRTLSGPGVAPGTVESLLNPDGTIRDTGPVEGHSGITGVVSKTTDVFNAVGSAGTGTTTFIPNVIGIIANPNQNIFQKAISIFNSLQPGGSSQSNSATQASKVGQQSGFAKILNPAEPQSLNPQAAPAADVQFNIESIRSTRFGSGITNPHFSSPTSQNPYEKIPQWFWDKVFPKLNLTCNSPGECMQKFSALPLADGNGELKLTLNNNYVPSDLVDMSKYGIPVATANNKISLEAAALVKKLIDDLNAEGAGVIVSYGYRSYSDQNNLRGDVGRLAALPGQSMHQAGITIDISYTRPNGTINPNKPLNNNSRITEILHQNGFVQPFPRTDPGHVVALDVIQPGLVQALIDAGINPDDEAIIKSVFLGMAQTYEYQAENPPATKDYADDVEKSTKKPADKSGKGSNTSSTTPNIVDRVVNFVTSPLRYIINTVAPPKAGPSTNSASVQPSGVEKASKAPTKNTRAVPSLNIEVDNNESAKVNPSDYVYFSQLDYTGKLKNKGCGIVTGAMVLGVTVEEYRNLFEKKYGLFFGGNGTDFESQHIKVLEGEGKQIIPITGTGVSLEEIKADIYRYTAEGNPVWINAVVDSGGGFIGHQMEAVGVEVSKDSNGNTLYGDIIVNNPGYTRGAVPISDSNIIEYATQKQREAKNWTDWTVYAITPASP